MKRCGRRKVKGLRAKEAYLFFTFGFVFNMFQYPFVYFVDNIITPGSPIKSGFNVVIILGSSFQADVPIWKFCQPEYDGCSYRELSGMVVCL